MERGLNESDIGEWTGRSIRWALKRPEWQMVRRYPSGFRFPGGESFTEMQTRITSAVGGLVARHPGETIVVVSNADPIKAVVAHALGIHLDLFQRIAIAPASITAISYRAETPLMLTLNSMNGDLAWLQTG